MASVWTCECGAVNKGTRSCDACGKSRRRGDDKPEQGRWRAFCSWTIQGTACRMRPTVQNQFGRQCCDWHDSVNDHRVENTRDAFEGWLTYWLNRKACGIWTHYLPEYLWACVSGIEPPHVEPIPCRREVCPYRPELEPAAFRGVPASLAQARQRMRDAEPVAVLLTDRGVIPLPLKTDDNAGW